jgi:hypothetical protein
MNYAPEFSARRSERKRARNGKCGGRKSYAEANPEWSYWQEKLAAERRRSLRAISAELAERGYLTANGQPFPASAVKSMLAA